MTTDNPDHTRLVAEVERLTRELAEARAVAGNYQVEVSRLAMELDASRAVGAKNASTLARVIGERDEARAYIRDIGHKPGCATERSTIALYPETCPCDCGFDQLTGDGK